MNKSICSCDPQHPRGGGISTCNSSCRGLAQVTAQGLSEKDSSGSGRLAVGGHNTKNLCAANQTEQGIDGEKSPASEMYRRDSGPESVNNGSGPGARDCAVQLRCLCRDVTIGQ